MKQRWKEKSEPTCANVGLFSDRVKPDREATSGLTGCHSFQLDILFCIFLPNGHSVSCCWTTDIGTRCVCRRARRGSVGAVMQSGRATASYWQVSCPQWYRPFTCSIYIRLVSYDVQQGRAILEEGGAQLAIDTLLLDVFSHCIGGLYQFAGRLVSRAW
jgi:hypothetical protein